MRSILIYLTLFFLRLEPSEGKNLPLPGMTFRVADHPAFLIFPRKRSQPGQLQPWVWYAPTLPGLPGKEEKWMFSQFLERGIAIAGIDVGESYGSPRGRQLYSALHKELTQNHGFSPRSCLLARSRGGLMLYNWAAENPSKVSCIAGIYPVCNIASWPGLARSCKAYGLTENGLSKALRKHNPIDRLEPLAGAKIPIFHIHGDKDRVVPLDANSATVLTRHRALGRNMTLKIIKDQGHNMWPGWFRDPDLVSFILQYASGRNN